MDNVVMARADLIAKFRDEPILTKMLTEEEIKNIPEVLLVFFADTLSEGRSISFQPLGHLVLCKVKPRMIIAPNKKKAPTKSALTVRMRQLPSKPYHKATQLASVMASKTPYDVFLSTIILRVWFQFLESCAKHSAKIQLRGFGRFYVRKKQVKQVLNFAPFPKLLAKLNDN
jgi:nucleoid DNA-binding protein